MRERHNAIETRFACSPEADNFNCGGTAFRYLLHLGASENPLNSPHSRGRVLGPMADTSPGRATRTLVERFDCGNTAIAFHRIVVFEAAIELGRVRKPLELSFDVKRLTEK
jgi:hypothetical protein